MEARAAPRRSGSRRRPNPFLIAGIAVVLVECCAVGIIYLNYSISAVFLDAGPMGDCSGYDENGNFIFVMCPTPPPASAYDRARRLLSPEQATCYSQFASQLPSEDPLLGPFVHRYIDPFIIGYCYETR